MIKTKRICFKEWSQVDEAYGYKLWQNPEVTRFIKQDIYSNEEVRLRLKQECENFKLYNLQYFPMFVEDNFIGVCGLKPVGDIIEMGFHLLPEYWHQGLAYEASLAIIEYAKSLVIKTLYCGHNPLNEASKKLVLKLGFQFIKDEYFAPTNKMHPLYQLTIA